MIDIEYVKNENDDLGLEGNSDWKTKFWNKENITTEDPITVPVMSSVVARRRRLPGQW